MFRRVAIIGGGAAAATLLGELLERPSPQPLHLDWYTGTGVPTRGIAYATRSAHHLLDVRAASMSLFAGKPRGFLDFVQRDDPGVAGTDFLPRHRYGDYLEAEVAHALQRGKALGHHVHVIPVTVDALVPESDGVTIMHGEESHQLDAAVLALGTLPPRPPPGVAPAALDCGRYIVDPWQLLADIRIEPAPRKVVLLGMGPTAVDVMLELATRWPQARFIAISRHGLLPESHLNTAAAPPDDSAELIEAMQDLPDIHRWLHLLREAIAQGTQWRALIDSLRPHTASLWAALPLEQRARFLRHARWAWERARHRMPPPTSQTIATLEQQGRLQRRCGRMQSADRDGDSLQLLITHAGQAQRLQADLVIQCTGADVDLRSTNHRLLSQLLTNAHITADPLGLGVMADNRGRLLHEGHAWPHLFALGALLRGTLWEANAMPEIRQQARALADQLRAD